MQVKDLHALGNCYFPWIWLYCVIFQDVVHSGSYSLGVIKYAKVRLCDFLVIKYDFPMLIIWYSPLNFLFFMSMHEWVVCRILASYNSFVKRNKIKSGQDKVRLDEIQSGRNKI